MLFRIWWNTAENIFTLVFVVNLHHPQGLATRQLDQGFTWFLLVLESLVFKFQVAMHAFHAASHINFKNFSPYAALPTFSKFHVNAVPQIYKVMLCRTYHEGTALNGSECSRHKMYRNSKSNPNAHHLFPTAKCNSPPSIILPFSLDDALPCLRPTLSTRMSGVQPGKLQTNKCSLSAL